MLAVDLLVQAGRLDEASHLLMRPMPSLSIRRRSVLAECIRIRGQIAACGNDLTGAVRLFEKAIAISQRQEARNSSSSAPQTTSISSRT